MVADPIWLCLFYISEFMFYLMLLQRMPPVNVERREMHNTSRLEKTGSADGRPCRLARRSAADATRDQP
jgi:hypothetical protein